MHSSLLSFKWLNPLEGKQLKERNFSSLSQTCTWKLFPDQQVLGGDLDPARTVEECQAACEKTASCESLDFVPSDSECYLLKTKEPKEPNGRVQHYERICGGVYLNINNSSIVLKGIFI